MIELNNCDCLVGLQELDDETLDLVVTSPPYNVDLGNNKHDGHKGYDLYDDNKEEQEYLSWLKRVFSLVYEKLKVSGRVCINIGNKKNGSMPTTTYVINFMEDIGYKTYTQIVWNKSQIGSRTAWGSFKSPSCPSFPTPFEFVLVFFKGSKKLQDQGETDLTKQEFIDWSLALWDFPPETRQQSFGHSAMFPEELPKRCIKLFSWVGATVCDPFMGVGTTALVCQKLNRDFIGFEISKDYVKTAKERLK